ncbi:hypothetical protein J4E90_009737 [Alternaria incomplexa]|uniref:uncharacterized protein n=1 Tax=Alternaria incomplexa TaxID=1187928 RepID=UPI00221ECF4D|nr:uncharacterized protein J4E90_009737 [Alternaria incomplexa]KAI4907235.1 hypothetical protein J4E90_009737 [Alternaria incomplexa]
MTTDIDDITVRVGGMKLGEDASDHVASLPQASRSLTRADEAINLHTRDIESVNGEADSSNILSTTEACSHRDLIEVLVESAKSLDKATGILEEATECIILETLKLRGSRSTNFGVDLLSHFDGEIRAIIREVLHTTKDENLLWKAAEECYKQATSYSGSLHASNYFESPEKGKREHKIQDHMENEQTWVNYWLTILNNAPNGPTLFYPPTSFDSHWLKFEDIPQYLFRIFDAAILGTDGVVHSIESSIEPEGNSRTDLLSLRNDRATTLLHAHLKKTCFSRETDNLTSWTSSLLFAIQYALYRRQCGQGNASEYKICAADTRKFPQGQFARDIWLIQKYESDGVGQAQDFFNFRLKFVDYYNGEYLSQGAVSIADRSCVTSLKQLEEAGLFKLYPEFEDATGRTLWARRVLELRRDWSEERGTGKKEIKLALQVARTCFPQLASVDVATALLTFRNRKLQPSALSGK